MAKKIRPRFSFYSDLSLKHVQDQFVTPENNNIKYTVNQNKIYMTHNQSLHHYWSPELVLSLYEQGIYTKINGLIGPQQTVWAMFLFLYAISFLLGFFIGLYGLILWSLGDFSYWLLSIPVSLILLGSIYLAASFGQKKGHDQMVELIAEFKATIQDQHLFNPDEITNEN